VKYPHGTALVILFLSASFALAEDFKTISGKEYKDATVSRIEADGIVLKTKSGISKVYFAELPKDVQERFGYDPAKAAQFAKVQAAPAQSNPVAPKQQTQATAENLHTIREVETDQPSFLDQPFLLKGVIEVSDYYSWGYNRAQQTHYSFKINDGTGRRCNAFMERGKAGGLRQQLLSAGGPIKGLFTVVLLGRRYEKNASLCVELLDYRIEQ